MLQLNYSVNAQKAPTGPNPQTRKNTTGYNEGNAGLPSAVNQGVRGTGTTQPQGSGPVAQSGVPQPAASSPSYDYNSDPVLQMIMGQQELAIQMAQSAALAQQKQALIAYGDSQLALAVTGDQTTADAAANNPFSTLATLAATNKQNVRNTNETENKANLFYSSDRGYQLGLAQQAYLQNQATESGKVQSTLTGIGAQLLASEQNAWNTEAQAQNDAYNRAITAAQNNALGTPAAVGGAPAQPSDAVQNAAGNYVMPANPYQGVAVNAPGAATAGSPGKTVGGYRPGGAINT